MIHIPNAVIPNAPTGLRVILNNDLNPLSPANLGCGLYVSGETEDYVVRFTRYPAGVGSVNGNLKDMSLYPNPTAGKFTISLNAGKAMDKVDITVSTIAGQTILQKSYKNATANFTADLDLTEQARGIYFVEIKADGDKIVRKLIVR